MGTRVPRQELLAETTHVLGKDSSLDYAHQPGRGVRERGGGYQTEDATAEAPAQATQRFLQNLQQSGQNTLSSGSLALSAPQHLLVSDEDPMFADRRRQEKNFSDLFGT